MVRRLAALLLVAVFLLPGAAEAQESRWAKIRSDGEHFADDIVHIWTSPFRADGSDLVVWGSVAAGLVGIAIFDDEFQDWIRDNPDALPVRVLAPMQDPKPLSLLGYTSYLLLLSGGLYATGLAFDNDGLRDAGIGCATADISGTFARHLLARLLGRMRPESTRNPYIIRPLAWGDWEMRSFPGGHAANIMACTAFWNNRFDLGFVGPLLYIAAAAIGMARVVDQAHWTTDTLFGIFFGWSVGTAVADRFNERRDDSGDPAASLVGPPPLGFTIGWRIPL